MAYSPSTRDENEEIISRVAKDVSSRAQLPHRPRLILVSTHGDFFYDCYFLIVTSQLEGKEKQVYWERVKRERPKVNQVLLTFCVTIPAEQFLIWRLST